MADSIPAALEYAPPARRIRPWLRRGLILAWAIGTVYLLYDKFGLWTRLQIGMLNAQRTASRHAEPADRVIFEGDLEKATPLVTTAGYRLLYDSDFDQSSLSVASDTITPPRQAYWHALETLDWWDLRNTPPARPTPGGGLFGGFGGDKGMGPRDEFPIFLHERRAGGGEPRLVDVTAYLYRDGSLRFDADVLSIAGPLGRPAHLTRASGPMMDAVVFALSPLRLYAPQPDPIDASRFTIAFVVESGVGTVEGRLKPDDTVEFRLVPGSGPAVQPKRVGNYDPADAEDPDPTADP